MELGRDINARGKSKSKVGQESSRYRRGRRRIIGDNKSIQLSLCLLSKRDHRNVAHSLSRARSFHARAIIFNPIG